MPAGCPWDVEAAIKQALERGADYFAGLWFSRSADEQALPVQGARGAATAPTSAVARGLIEYDVPDLSGEVAVPLVLRWVRENRLGV